jgi:hypothetical protein
MPISIHKELRHRGERLIEYPARCHRVSPGLLNKLTKLDKLR